MLRTYAEPLRVPGLQGLFTTYFERVRRAGREMANASWREHLRTAEERAARRSPG